METSLTEDQMKRQDLVDNAIYDMICSINPTNKDVDWQDVSEIIGDIRDVVFSHMGEKWGCSEMEFYPFVE